MNLLNYLVTALSISVIMTLIPFILGYRNKIGRASCRERVFRAV